MSTKEWNDNLTFLSTLQMLEGLIAHGLLTASEGELVKTELKRRLRPTLLTA